MASSSHRSTALVLGALSVLAAGTFLRFYRLQSIPEGLYHDEAFNGDDCLRNLDEGRLRVFYPDNAGREGLFINLETMSVFCFGNTSWALRLPSAILGTLTVLGVLLLGGELFSWRAGLLAAFLTATSFWHIVLSRLAFRAIAAPVFLTFGCYVLLLGLRSAEVGRAYTGRIVLAGVLYGLGFHTYIAYRATPFLVAAILIHHAAKLGHVGRRLVFWRASALFCIAALIVVTPLLCYFLRQPAGFAGRASQISVLHSPNPAREIVLNTWRTARMFFVHGDRNWRQNYAYRAELFWPVGLLFALGVVTALLKPTFPHRFVLFWMVIGAAPAILSNDSLPHALRSILLVPASFILAALGGLQVYRALAAHADRRLWGFPAAVVLALLAYEPYHTYFHRWAPRAEVAQAMEWDATALARSINALPKGQRKLVSVYGADVEGQLPAETAVIQYLTRSFTAKQEGDRNIVYIPIVGPPPCAGPSCCAVARFLPDGTVAFCIESHRGI